ncbi:SDR family NAD(P)-dependent oxidoreductase [Paraburkholderia panacisoli]|uniref:SDR family NAD(P)-dependent oxidoreductase n=1 Tax=Paraburkholderia panacisoli TaxID=2603818 RepID=A0A5B0HJ05_9BURK|nr:SDR family oxidoreductase [Paraburkholderia panacisoli]KAA1015108.1 SDR family NAD(P)-dependent oxidoreductase [Paraburkholderia panacisoli]
MANWSTADIPRQTGRLAVITGATGGLGLETALALAGAGADVVLTGRSAQKGAAALAAIRARHPAASVRYEHLDLASLASVREFAGQFAQGHAALDLLINNAGVMMPPTRQTTSDGFELQFGTNYLGQFALTERLLPLLRAARQPRVVNLGSIAHKNGAAIHFDDLQWQRSYKPWSAYGQSKLAMLVFALELQRRSEANGWGLLSNAAHPGYARTDLIANGPGADGLLHALNRRTLEPLLSQSAADGALPTLFAAAAPHAKPAGYYGPTGFFELKGPPGEAQIARPARDQAVATRLWEISEALTHARWPSAIEEQVS